MKTTDFIKESIGEDADEMHRDHEVQMARSDCYNAARYAIELHKMLHHIAEQQGLDGWVSEKITLANDYLRTVWEYLRHEGAGDDQQDAMPVFSFENAEKQFDELLKESGEVVKTKTGLVHHSKDKYGAGEEPRAPSDPGKYARDLEHLNKGLTSKLDKSMGISFDHGNTKVKEGEPGDLEHELERQDYERDQRRDAEAEKKANEGEGDDPYAWVRQAAQQDMEKRIDRITKPEPKKGFWQQVGDKQIGMVKGAVQGAVKGFRGESVKESASAGGVGAGAFATGPTAGGGKPGTGKPKAAVANAVKRAKPKFGKGIY